MTRLLPAIAIVFICSASAAAHQLDEYLQATRIGIEKNRVTLDMSLTPGSRVADRVFAMLDANGDERVSAAEIERYARRVLSDVSLSVDGGACRLTLARAESPSRAEMQDGVGSVHINAVADSFLGGGRRHELRFVNRHQPDIGVYLVNALTPPAGIAIQAQERDVQQRGIRLDVELSAAYLAAWQIISAVVIGGGLVLRRRSVSSRCNTGASRS